MRKYWLAAIAFSCFLGDSSAKALELQGFITQDCQRHVGVVIHASNNLVETIGIDGRYHAFAVDDIETIYVFNLIENPFVEFRIDQAALNRLKAVHVEEDDGKEGSLAFPVRFIEDLIIFYSLDGKSHVHRMADIFKLRPAPPSALRSHRPRSSVDPGFEFADQTAKCPAQKAAKVSAIKPTRVLADKISISEFLNSFEQGYDRLESFQERTYLYAKPMMFDTKSRLGLMLNSKPKEPAIEAPFYFQWGSGEPYRFQSLNVIGTKNHEFLPNTEPVFALRTDVKSHIFHATFIGNVVGLAAGDNVFLGSSNGLKLKQTLDVQPSLNYLAMMGGDFGPYSLSGGLYYPTFGIRVGDEVREVLGSEASYAMRAMYTKRDWRVRVIGSLTDYQKGVTTKEDVLADSVANVDRETVSSYKFDAVFLRGGLEYELSRRLSIAVDGIYVGGNYKETQVYGNSPLPQSSDIRFTKFTTQFHVRQTFGRYVAISAFANLIQNSYESNFLNKDQDKEIRETHFFGTMEFIF